MRKTTLGILWHYGMQLALLAGFGYNVVAGRTEWAVGCGVLLILYAVTDARDAILAKIGEGS